MEGEKGESVIGRDWPMGELGVTKHMPENTSEPYSFRIHSSFLTILNLGSKFLKLGTMYMSVIWELREGFLSLMYRASNIRSRGGSLPIEEWKCL